MSEEGEGMPPMLPCLSVAMAEQGRWSRGERKEEEEVM